MGGGAIETVCCERRNVVRFLQRCRGRCRSIRIEFEILLPEVRFDLRLSRAVENEGLGLRGPNQDAENEGMEGWNAGGDDGKVLRDLYAQHSGPVVVRKIGRKAIAIEEVQLSRDGANDAASVSKVPQTDVMNLPEP